MGRPNDPSGRSVAGTPGASARREHERRRAARERRTLERHPRVGRLMLAVARAPAHETAWERGALGEEAVAEVLAERLGADVRLLHDRRAGRGGGNIDHIAVAPSGVWVIDAKRYAGAVAVRRPLLGPPRLTVAGRDRSALAEAVLRQAALVRAPVAEIAPRSPVHGVLCFVDARLPALRDLSYGGCAILSPRRLARRIGAGGPPEPAGVNRLADELARRFPPA